MYLSEPTTVGLVEAEESAIRVRMKEEIEPKEAAVNKREGRVSLLQLESTYVLMKTSDEGKTVLKMRDDKG
jgi:hypothetical protein